MARNDIKQAAKKPNARSHYTPKELLELKRCAEDPLYFIENFMWVRTVDSRQKIVPYEYQKEIVRIFAANRYSIALTGRQLGKCLQKKSIINIRNKTTGQQYDITVGEFYEWQKFKEWHKTEIQSEDLS